MDANQLTPLRLVYEQLLNDRRVRNQSDLADKTGFDHVAMSRMLRGDKPIPYRLLSSLFDLFGVNINFLISNGQGPIYVPRPSEDDDQLTEQAQQAVGYRVRAEVLEKDLADCKGQVGMLKKLVDLQGAELDRLKNAG